MNENDYFCLLKEISVMKKEYAQVLSALQSVRMKGYGVITPNRDEIVLDSPQVMKHGNKFGVKIRAQSPSIHLIKANIETEINPIVGTEQQSEELVKYLLREFEEDPGKIWESNLFGKSLYELVGEGLHAKLDHMPEEARAKLEGLFRKAMGDDTVDVQLKPFKDDALISMITVDEQNRRFTEMSSRWGGMDSQARCQVSLTPMRMETTSG